MPTTERRANTARRRRCRLIFGWLNRSELWLTVASKIMRAIAIIAGTLSLLGFILHHFGEVPQWLLEILAKA